MAIVINGETGAVSGVQTLDSVSINENGVSVANKTQLGLKADITSINTANSSYVMTALNATGTAPIYACRAWVNFNGTGIVAIRASGNVSSITDNGAGIYTVNFSTIMPDSNYSLSGILGQSTIEDGQHYVLKTASPNSGRLSNSVRICTEGNSGLMDFTDVNVTVFR